MPFVKGKSGNPGGRPKEVKAVIELARSKTELAINRLAEIAASSTSDAAAVAACTALLDRGWGKPTQPISGDDERPALQVLVTGPAPISPADWQAKHAPKE